MTISIYMQKYFSQKTNTMTQKEQVNDLFLKILRQSKISHTFANGFDKYIVYNENGSLFSVGFNKTIKKYGIGRTDFMLKEYNKANLPTEIMPDAPYLYNEVIKRYDTYNSMAQEFQSIFDLLNRFTGKNGQKR